MKFNNNLIFRYNDSNNISILIIKVWSLLALAWVEQSLLCLVCCMLELFYKHPALNLNVLFYWIVIYFCSKSVWTSKYFMLSEDITLQNTQHSEYTRQTISHFALVIWIQQTNHNKFLLQFSSDALIFCIVYLKNLSNMYNLFDR